MSGAGDTVMKGIIYMKKVKIIIILFTLIVLVLIFRPTIVEVLHRALVEVCTKYNQ